MTDGRICMPVGTSVEFDNGDLFYIIGEPIGCGGGSILYPARKQSIQNGILKTDDILYALKECYPAPLNHAYKRLESGEIVPVNADTEASAYLNRAQLMQLAEKEKSQKIYRTASRMIPIRRAAQSVRLSLPGQNPSQVSNTVTLMDSLTEKGQSLTTWIRKKRRFTPTETFRIIQQILFALQEVHEAGYLHLDIQDGNVFLRGTLEQKNELVTLIDFGCARELIHGKTEPILDKVIFTTQGFSAPEILLRNDGNLQLGPEADLYSVGCLALYLLTGQRANVRELIANRTGVYLRSNQIRRIQCPKHLIDTMQDILSKALAKEPENRYPSAERMLADINKFLEALQPYRPALSAVCYDAFICYRHSPVDSAAALSLQRALENFRAPKSVSAIKRPFNRVFVDEGELSSCADFGQQIREALKNSKWLIVLCSPDTPLSPWVQQEIDTFLEYHDRSRILAVLLEGTPETAFPPQLKGDLTGIGEVFAAHAISSTPQEAERLMKADALLKIAAPMLHTTYDALKQRHKIYRLQRSAVLAALFLIFTAYAINRANVINEQARRIAEEQKQAQLLQAQTHIAQAEKKYDENDTLGAIELLLPILTSEEQDPSVQTNASFLLGKILGIYETPATALQSAAPSGLIDTDCREFFLDPAGDYLFAWNGTENKVQIWSAENLQFLHMLSPSESIVYTEKDLLIPGRNALIVQTSGSIVCFDYLTGEQIWETKMDDAKSLCFSREQNQLIVLRSEYRSQTICAEILSVETGTVLQQIPFQIQENHHISHLEQLRISSDGNWLVFSAEDAQAENEFNNSDTLYLLNLKTGACQLLADSGTSVSVVEMFNQSIVVMRWSGKESASQFSMIFEAYDCATQKRLWYLEQEFLPKSAGGECMKRIPGNPGEYGDRVLFAFADKCLLVDFETGELLRSYEMQSPIAEVICYAEDGFNVLCSDGSFTLASYDHSELLTIQLISNAVTSATSCNGTDFYVQYPSNSSQDYRIRKFVWGRYDNAYVSLYEAERKEWYLGETYREQNRNSAIRLEQPGKIRYVDLDSGSVRDYPVPEEYGFSGGFSSDGESVYWSGGSLYGSYGSVPYYLLNLNSGEIEELIKPEEFDENISVSDILFFDNNLLLLGEEFTDGQAAVCLYCWNLKDNTFIRKYSKSFAFPVAMITNHSFRGNSADKQGFFVIENDKFAPAAFVRVDLETNDAKTVYLDFSLEETGSSYSDELCYQWSDSGSKLVFGYQKQIYLVDEKGSLLWCIPTTNEISETLFSPDEDYLYAVEENGAISKYRAADGKCVDSISLRDYCAADGMLRGNLFLSCNTVNWIFIDESELLIYDDSNGGFLMDTSGDRLLMKAVLPKCCGYDQELDQFLVTDGNYISGQVSSIGVFRRYRTEDLIEKAKAFIHAS